MIYDVDNRYPEIAPMYEKIRGVKRHGGLYGSRELIAARRAARINNLKRSFWTSAAAVIAVIIFFIGGGERSPEASGFIEPYLRIVSAEQSQQNAQELRYIYSVDMNSADSVDVYITARTEDGVILGTDGPFRHTRSETSDEMTMLLNRTDGIPRVILEISGVYSYNNEEHRMIDLAEVPLRAGLPEPSPEPATDPIPTASVPTDGPTDPTPTEPIPTEPAPTEPTPTEPAPTEPTPTEPAPTEPTPTDPTPTTFTAPTLGIASAALDGSNAASLTYTYQTTLNSAQNMQVRAAITSDNGENLGTDGPFTRSTSGVSPAHTVALSWTTRPKTVTLTLTGSYYENGVRKTLTASRTLTVPETFTAPTLGIDSAALNGTAATALNYVYTVNLNSAESMQVRAAVTADSGASLGSGGPYTHSASGTSPTRSAALSWATRPTTVTLTLTGTYTENGAVRTVTASRTLNVEVEPFTAPTLTISSAELNGTAATALNYVYQVTLNSAESMQVTASITSDAGDSIGSGGPYSHTASGASPTRSSTLNWSTRPATVTLTLTGTYTENGVTKTVTASQTVNVENGDFTAPTLTIRAAALNGAAVTPLTYTYNVTLNSAESMQVTAAFTSESGASLGTDGPFSHTASGDSPSRSAALTWATRPTTVTLTLTGTYTENGAAKTVTATQTLNVEAFTAPVLTIASASLNGANVTPLSYSYTVTLNSAESMQVRAVVTSNTGANLGAAGPYSHTSSGTSATRTCALTWATRPTTVTLTLTGTYTEDGATKTVTATRTLTVPEETFTDPTLEIKTAKAIQWLGLTAFNYTVTLNDAASMDVKAVITYETEEENDDGDFVTVTKTFVEDGPNTHSSSLTTDLRTDEYDGDLEEFPEFTLTLTGTYMDKSGTTHEIVVTKVLELFEIPSIWITDAWRDDSDPLKVLYSAEVYMNDAENLSVSATVFRDDVTLGTAEAFDVTTDQTFTDLEVQTTDGADIGAVLQVTGTFEIEDKSFEILDTRYVPPAAITAPNLTIDSASLDPVDMSPLTYSYTVELNSAESMRVDAKVTLDGGDEVWGTDGPYDHDSSGSSPEHTIDFDWASVPTTVTLTLTGTYEDNGVTKTVTATEELEVAFTEPTITILSAQREAGNLLNIIYSAQIELNSAAELTLNVEVRSDTISYAADGPFTIDSTQALNDWVITALDSTGEEVRLVLTGTYERFGVTYEISDSMVVSDPPFTAPTLTIDDTAFTDPYYTPLVYDYTVTLNSAASMTVTASLVDDTGIEIGVDGPYTHSASGSVTGRELEFDLAAYPETVTLTLTGTYEEGGVTKTVTASSTIDFPPQFVEPTITILSAEKDGATRNVVVYSAQIELNSADSLDLYVNVASPGTDYGTTGPTTYTGGQTLTNQRFAGPGIDADDELVLTLRGTYQRDGVSYEITQTMDVADAAMFEEPTLVITSVERMDTPESGVQYAFSVVYNSAGVLDVYARFFDESDTMIYETAHMTCDAGDDFGPYSVDTGALASYMYLYGTYEYLGETHTIQEYSQLPPATPFTAPSFTGISTNLPDVADYGETTLTYGYTINVGDADSVTVSVSARSDAGVELASRTFAAVDVDRTYTGQNLVWTYHGGETSVTVVFTAAYQENGVDKTVETTEEILVSFRPISFESGGEIMPAADVPNALYMEYWAKYLIRDGDPHASGYDFEVTRMSVNWYDEEGTWIGSNDLDSSVIAQINIDKASDSYEFSYNGTIPISDVLSSTPKSVVLYLFIRDVSTERSYSTSTNQLAF